MDGSSFDMLGAVLVLVTGAALAVGAIRQRRRRWVLFAAIASAFTAIAWSAASLRTPPLLETEVPYRPIAVPSEGFVTSDSCRSCHPGEYASWHRSYHRTMTQLASPDTVLGYFPTASGPSDPSALELHEGGRAYRLGRHEDVYWIAFQEGEGLEQSWVQRPVLMMTGSHHVQGYWYPTGQARKMALFTFVHLVRENRWVPRRAVFLLPPPTSAADHPQPYSAGERWNHTCIHCHTTDGRPYFDTLDSKVSEFGIACEACHGPGEEHVEANRNPLRRYEQHLSDSFEPDIVQPLDLDHERSSMVCSICHSINYPRGDEVFVDLSIGRQFRPGDDLEETRRLVQPTRGLETLAGLPEAEPWALRQAFWSDGMVRVKGREYNGLVETACYQRGTLSCFSCHAMHQPADDPRALDAWADDQLKPGMRTNLACVQCHVEYEDEAVLAAHTLHEPSSSGSNCYNCHMPFTTYGLLKAIRSHQVDSPSVLVSQQTGRPNACTNCHLDKTFGWAAEQLETGWGVEAPELGPIEAGVPASLLFLLSGDASQRALMAWHMAWRPAREVSGTHWMTPFLSQTLIDPYDAVRFNATEAMRLQAGFDHLEIDYLASDEELRRVARQIAEQFRQLEPPPGGVANPADLLSEGLDPRIFELLVARRNDRMTALAE
ncbi:MAG: hypothetical protein MI919_19600 [Holophagales bacterium]|nr:hypothetical protein [Holophagales bacterium]